MSLQTGVLNFALFTKLPSPHFPSLFLAVTAFAAGVGHASRPRRAPGQTTSRVLGFARNRSLLASRAAATRPTSHAPHADEAVAVPGRCAVALAAA